MLRNCRVCGERLTVDTMQPSCIQSKWWICRSCVNARTEKRRRAMGMKKRVRNTACNQPGCPKPPRGRFCPMHYRRKRLGLPMSPGPRYEACPEPVSNRTEKHRWAKFRLTPSMWVEISKNGCRICGSHRNLIVDHEHGIAEDENQPRDPALIRGALCQSHNVIVGKHEFRSEEAERYLKMKRPFP